MSTRQFTFTVASTALPAWVPTTLGVFAEAPMTNTLDSVAGTGVWQTSNSKLQDFSGGVFNPHYSPYGALIVHGGGHSATQDNGVYIADMTTLAWDKPGASTDLQALGKFVNYVNLYGLGNGTSYDYFIQNGPNSTEWANAVPVGTAKAYEYSVGAEFANDGALNPREVATGVPGSAHTYDSMTIVPPGVGGAGSKGMLVRAGSGAVGATASRTTGWAHKFDFASQSWARLGSASWNGAGTPAFCGVYADRTTQGGSHEIWRFPPESAQTPTVKFDLVTNAPTVVNGTQDVPGYIDLHVAAYHQTRDIFVEVISPQYAGTESASFYWINPKVNGARTLVTWTNASAPRHGTSGANTLCYIPDLDQFFYYTRWNPNVYYLITVPPDPANPWTHQEVNISGSDLAGKTDLAAGTANSVFTLSREPAIYLYRRMDYAPALKSVVWAPGREGANPWGGRIFAIRVVP